jgi:hypothetical protein
VRLPDESRVVLAPGSQLASSAPALAEGIARELGQRPSTIAFGGRDTIRIVFWNPTIWQDDMDSKVLPQKSLPLIRAATRNVAVYVWKAIGREAGVSLIDVEFVRVVHDQKYIRPNHEVPAEVVRGQMTRQMIETGRTPVLTVVLGEGGAWNEKTKQIIDSLKRGSEKERSTRAALTAAIQRAIGQPAVDVAMKGVDTIDVVVSNPTFWWKDDTSKAFPETSLPAVRQAAKRAAESIWDRHGRNAGINVIRLTFRRAYRELVDGVLLQRPAQDITLPFTRQQLETGALESARLTIVQR